MDSKKRLRTALTLRKPIRSTCDLEFNLEEYYWINDLDQLVVPADQVLQKRRIDIRKLQLASGPQDFIHRDENILSIEVGVELCRPPDG